MFCQLYSSEKGAKKLLFFKRSLNAGWELYKTEFLVEFIYAAAGVNELLLSGVERVALGADFNGDVLLSAAGLDDGAAGAADGGGLVIGMDSGLHNHYLLNQSCLECAKTNAVTRRKQYYSRETLKLQGFFQVSQGFSGTTSYSAPGWRNHKIQCLTGRPKMRRSAAAYPFRIGANNPETT